LNNLTLNNNGNYPKNTDAAITGVFANSDNGQISAMTVNNISVPVESGATMTNVVVFENTGNNASSQINDLQFAISGFTYFDGYNNIEYVLPTTETLLYTVQKNMPTATVSNINPLADKVTFDVGVNDADNALTITELNANVYLQSDLTNVVATAVLPVAGASSIEVNNLSADEGYVVYISGSYNTLNGSPLFNTNISTGNNFNTISNQEIVVSNLNMTSTPNVITINNSDFNGSLNDIVSGQIIINDGTNIITYDLTTSEINSIKTGQNTIPIIIGSNFASNTNYEISFLFMNSAREMTVKQALTNQIMTRKASPVINTVPTLNSQFFAKNTIATTTSIFSENVNDAVISTVIIDNNAVIVDASSTFLNVVANFNVAASASSVINDQSATISGYIYNDGFEDQNIIVDHTLVYTVEKAVPTAIISQLQTALTTVTFDVALTDDDGSLVSNSAQVDLYKAADLTTIINSVNIADSGANNLVFSGLDPQTDYVMNVTASYDNLETQINNGLISQQISFETAIDQNIIVDNLLLSSTTNSMTIENATFTGGYYHITAGIISISEVMSPLDYLFKNQTQVSDYQLTPSDITSINTTGSLDNLEITTNLNSNTNYEVTFSFESTGVPMIVTQFTNNTYFTHMLQPVVNSILLDNINYAKNADSLMTVSLNNIDSAIITGYTINGLEIPIDSNSTLVTSYVTQTVSAVPSANDTYTVSAISYNDGFADITNNLNIPLVLTYNVLKEDPIATFANLISDINSVTFDLLVTDLDIALLQTTLLEISVYEQGTVINPVSSITVDLTGGNDLTIAGLIDGTAYDLYATGTYNNNSGQVTEFISQAYPFSTTTSQVVDVTDLQMSGTTDQIIIDSANFSNGFRNIISGQIVVSNGTTNTNVALTQAQIAEIINGSITTPILFDPIYLSNTAYTVTFNFNSSNGAMTVNQFNNNQITTRKAAPVLTAGSANLNSSSYQKLADSILNMSFTNIDSATFSEVLINGG